MHNYKKVQTKQYLWVQVCKSEHFVCAEVCVHNNVYVCSQSGVSLESLGGLKVRISVNV